MECGGERLSDIVSKYNGPATRDSRTLKEVTEARSSDQLRRKLN